MPRFLVFYLEDLSKAALPDHMHVFVAIFAFLLNARCFDVLVDPA